ncbi:MAG: hypothetical protein QM487_00750 [Candidatus Marithrix sp.]
MKIAKEQLKQEIDYLDDQYLELIYNILRQFPHVSNTSQFMDKPVNKLLDVLITLEEINDKFPDIDINLLPLDDIIL